MMFCIRSIKRKISDLTKKLDGLCGIVAKANMMTE